MQCKWVSEKQNSCVMKIKFYPILILLIKYAWVNVIKKEMFCKLTCTFFKYILKYEYVIIRK